MFASVKMTRSMTFRNAADIGPDTDTNSNTFGSCVAQVELVQRSFPVAVTNYMKFPIRWEVIDVRQSRFAL
jgi:hypothetical protein